MAAFAIPVSGSFSLVSDGLGAGGPAGTVLANGNFETSALPDDVTTNGFTDSDGNPFDTVLLTVFNVYDLTNNVGDFILGDANTSVIRAPQAILQGPAPESVLGFSGTLLNSFGGAFSLLVLNGPNATSAPGQPAQFGAVGVSASIDYSGIQVVPEPTALALLGAGLFAFGFARRRA